MSNFSPNRALAISYGILSTVEVMRGEEFSVELQDRIFHHLREDLSTREIQIVEKFFNSLRDLQL